MCAGGYGLANQLARSMPRRRPSFLKRHPECKHDPSRSNRRKRIPFKFTPRNDKKLIYYSERQRFPMGLNKKVLYVLIAILGIPVAVGALVHIGDDVAVLIFPGFIALTWLVALCYMAYEHWHRPPRPYRKEKARTDVQAW